MGNRRRGSTGGSAWRRARLIGVAGVVLASVAPLWTAGADAETPVEPGTGTAFAQAVRVDPKAGGLSIGLSFGQSTATHTNQVAKAVSTSTNLGVVGLTLGAQNCDGTPPTWAKEGQPQPTTTDSRDPDAAKWKREGEKYSREGRDFAPPEQAFLKQVRAASTPHGEAETVMMGGSNDPDAGEGNIKMGNAVTRTSSGLVNGVREARATAEIEYLELRSGTRYARFNGLRWDALHQSTGNKTVKGDFSIGWADIDGTVVSAEKFNGNETAVLDPANAILKSAGLKLVPGKTRIADDRSSITIEPLALIVVPNADRDSAAKTVFGTTTYREQRKSLFDTILTTKLSDPRDPKQTYVNGCRAGTYISLVDIIVGSVTGAGEFIVSLGGAEASTGEAFKNDFNLELGGSGFVGGSDIPQEPAVDSLYIGTTADLAAGTLGGVGVAPTAPAPSTPRTRLIQPAGASSGSKPFKGTRGGGLAAVGLVTLGVLAVVAEGDRRMMRAQRQAEAGP